MKRFAGREMDVFFAVGFIGHSRVPGAY